MKPCAFAIVIAVPIALAGFAGAAVPAGYMGQPYKGTPWPIPGRIDFVNYDTGGLGVGFNTVHHGDVACPGFDYRNDLPVPTLCKTSQTTGQFNDKPDEYTAGPLTGMFYPSATTADYYIGAVRPGDWVNVTVNVATAGTYQLYSTWASGGGSIDMKISFNDMLKNETKAPTTGGYHNWVPFPNFATMELEAGVQVLKFQSVVEHLNIDYLQFSLVTDGGVDNGSDGSTGGAGGATGSDSGPAAEAGAGGTSSQGGAAGSSGAATGSSGMGTSGDAAPMGNGGTAAALPASANESSGCACAIASVPALSARNGLASASLAVAAVIRLRRRRNHRAMRRPSI
jgi:beta-glucosidase